MMVEDGVNKPLDKISIAALGFALLLTAVPGAASGLRDSAWVSAQWALATGNLQALAESITLYLEEGGTLTEGDPFSALQLIDELGAMAGGAALAQTLISTQARGQFGGAPRIDIVLEKGRSHLTELTLAAEEVSWIEARLWRGSAGADIDLELFDSDGAVLAADLDAQTGTEGLAALLQLSPKTCLEVTLRVTNVGTATGRVALLIPQTLQLSCGDPG